MRSTSGDATAPLVLPTPTTSSALAVDRPAVVSAPAHARSFPTPLELLTALKRRWAIAGLLGLLLAGTAAAAVWFALPTGKHQARSLVQVRKNPASYLGKGTHELDTDGFKQNQAILLKTRLLLNRVVAKPKVAQFPTVQESADPAKAIETAITVKWESPEIMAVTMTGDDPQYLKVVLDTLVGEYLEDAQSDEKQLRESKLKLLETTRADLVKQISAKQANLQALAQTGNSPDAHTNTVTLNLYVSEFTRILAEIGRLQKEVRLIETERTDLDTQVKHIDELPIEPDILQRTASDAPSVREKAEMLARAKAEHKKLEGQVTKDHPLFSKSTEELRKAEKEYQAAIQEIRPEIEGLIRTHRRREMLAKIDQCTEKLKYLQRQVAADEDEKKRLETQIQAMRKGSLGTMLATDELKPLMERRDTISREILQLQLEQRADSRLQLREESVVSLNQNLQRKIAMAGVAGVAILACVLLAVALLEWRTRRVDSVDLVVNEMGMRVLGTIPAFPNRNALLTDDGHWRCAMAESVSAARTMILHTAKANAMQVLMITSATEGEGKTSLACQLGTSLATAGMRTLILDCDMRNPTAHKLFDRPLTPGCAEVLCQEVDVSESVTATSVPDLWLIPAGNCTTRVISALAQGSPLEILFNRLRGQFDIIIVDSCPVLPVADALLVGQHVDGVLISIMQNVSQLPKVVTASEKLVQLNIPLLGAVVSGTKPEPSVYGYNYVKQLPA